MSELRRWKIPSQVLASHADDGRFVHFNDALAIEQERDALKTACRAAHATMMGGCGNDEIGEALEILWQATGGEGDPQMDYDELMYENAALKAAAVEDKRRIAELEAVITSAAVDLKDVHQFMCPVNAVTAYHRHGTPVPSKRLTELCNRQIEVEKVIDKIGKTLFEGGSHD